MQSHHSDTKTWGFVTNYRSVPKGSKKFVQMGGGERHKAEGFVSFELEIERKMTLRIDDSLYVPLRIDDSLYVPTAIANLISIIQTAQQDCEICFTCDRVSLRNDANEKVVIVRRLDGMYQPVQEALYARKTVCWADQQPVALVVSTELMRSRLRHLGATIMHNMHQTKDVQGMPNKLAMPVNACDVCMKAEQPRLPFDSSDSKRRVSLALVHADMGPFPCPSLGGVTICTSDDG